MFGAVRRGCDQRARTRSRDDDRDKKACQIYMRAKEVKRVKKSTSGTGKREKIFFPHASARVYDVSMPR